MKDAEKSTSSIKNSPPSSPETGITEIEVHSNSKSWPHMQVLDLNNKIDPPSHSSKSHFFLKSSKVRPVIEKSNCLHGKTIQFLLIHLMITICLVFDKKKCTVLAKIIEPRHKINVYEKFYFSRKSISPLIYNTI